MKVKLRIIKPPYTDVPTKSLQAILRNHAHDKLLVHISIEQLYDIMGILSDRREASGSPFKSNQEALAEFKQYYLPKARRQLTYDYAGGYDHCLVELSDVLPASAYAVKPKKP